MINKILKKITLILIPIIIFFIGTKCVNATVFEDVEDGINNIKDGIMEDAEVKCTWYTYQTFIDINGSYINLEKVQNLTSHLTRIYSLTVYAAPSGKTFYSLKQVIDPEIKVRYDSEAIENIGLRENSFECPKYVKILPIFSLNDTRYYIEKSNSNEFKSYLNNQYINPKIVDGLSFKVIGIFNKNNFNGDHPAVFTSNNMGIGTTKRYNEMKNVYSQTFKKLGLEKKEVSSKYYNKEYYDVAVAKWDKKINSLEKYLDCTGETACDKNKIKAQGLKRWFEFNWRFILEEDLGKFRKYYKVAYYTEFSKEDMENIETQLNNFRSLEKYEELKKKITDNKCEIYCLGNSKSTSNACTSPDKYKSCNDAIKKCKSEKDGECLKNILGESEYNQLIKKQNDLLDKYDKKNKELKNSIVEGLSSLETTSIKGVKFGKYKVNCDDVKFLHTFYTILRVLAPLLVILMGTLDYTKSVLGADEKKILEARKKFPKRLILLILFILVPFIISVLLDAFSVSNTSLMSCVIKGA